MVKLLDCTTRDGGHTTNWHFDFGFVEDLINRLNQYGVSYYEAGYRNHYDAEGKGEYYSCSPSFMKNLYEIKQNLQIGVMVDYKRFNSDDFPGIEEDYIDFIRIATHPQDISNSLILAKILLDRGYKIFIQLMEISNIDVDGYIALFEWEYKDMLESLYLADSYGVLRPEDIKEYFDKLKMLGYKRISFHAHNNLGCAVANSLEAVKNGAYSVDGTLNGIGRCGGNSDIEELLSKI